MPKTITGTCPKCHTDQPIEVDDDTGDHGLYVTCDHCGFQNSLRSFQRTQSKDRRSAGREIERADRDSAKARSKHEREDRARLHHEAKHREAAERDLREQDLKEKDARRDAEREASRKLSDRDIELISAAVYDALHKSHELKNGSRVPVILAAIGILVAFGSLVGISNALEDPVYRTKSLAEAVQDVGAAIASLYTLMAAFVFFFLAAMYPKK